jgi:hypothetical protein
VLTIASLWVGTAISHAQTQSGQLPPAPLLLLEELFEPAEAWSFDYWRGRPPAADLIDLPLDPVASDADRDAVALMKDGWFQPVSTFPPVEIGVPPPWDVNPYNSNTWDLYRHALTWTEPLVKVWLTDGDDECLALMCAIIDSWRLHNPPPGGASAYAWNDCASAWRTQRLVWFWEMYRPSANHRFRAAFATPLLYMIREHAEYCADDANYNPNSNHGLMLTTSLLEVVGVLPEYRDSSDWHGVVDVRMPPFLDDNFSAAGFHMEQTPSYHKYMVGRIAEMAAFINRTGMAPVPQMDETARRAASLEVYLSRPNGVLASIGDCSRTTLGDYLSRWYDWWGDDLPGLAESTLPNPRADDSRFLVDFESGYAVFFADRIYVPGACRPRGEDESDMYAVFRCNATSYNNHVHADTLSFTLYGLGWDWLIDSGGPWAYVFTQERYYVIGYRAHNVVLVDESDSVFQPVELVDFDRTEQGDYVECRHHLETAQQTRRLLFTPPYTVELRDTLVSTDATPHAYSQVFHVHDEMTVEIVSDTRLEIVAPDGNRCAIEQSGVPGTWSVHRAQTSPYWQGWYTPSFMEIEPAPAIYFTTAPCEQCEFNTTIQLIQPPPVPTTRTQHQDPQAAAPAERSGW